MLLKIHVLYVFMPCGLLDVFLGVFDPEDEGATILRNVTNAYQSYQSYQSTQHDILDIGIFTCLISKFLRTLASSQ